MYTYTYIEFWNSKILIKFFLHFPIFMKIWIIWKYILIIYPILIKNICIDSNQEYLYCRESIDLDSFHSKFCYLFL